MANNQLLASDDFVSGSLAAGWSAVSGVGNEPDVVEGSPNVTEPTAVGTQSFIYWSGLTWPNDHASEITVQSSIEGGPTEFLLGVRIQPSTGYGYYLTASAPETISLQYYDGSSNVLATATLSSELVGGDILTLQAAGSCISFYRNGERILYVSDTNLTGGYPGYGQYSGDAVTNTQVSSWRGYSAIQQDGIWQKQGVVLAPIAADLANSGFGVYEGSCIYDTNPQILTQYTNVYKLWFSAGPGSSSSVYYAESSDLQNWSRYDDAVISSVVTPGIIKNGNTYYLYCQAADEAGSGDTQLYTSTNGISWSQVSANVFASGGYPLKPIAIISGTWYALYGILGDNEFAKVYLATSTDGAGETWTAYEGNPVISTPSTYPFPCVAEVNGTWYVWMQAGPSSPQNSADADNFDPNECSRWSTKNFIDWDGPVHSLHHSQMHESLNTPINDDEAVGGVAPVAIFDIDGNATMLYLLSQGDNLGPQVSQFSVAIGPTTIAQLVTQNEDAVQQTETDSFTSGEGNLDSNWTTLSGLTALKIVSGDLCEPSATSGDSCAAAYTGASFSASHYAEITLETLSASGAKASPLVCANSSNGSYYSVVIAGDTGSQSFQAQLARSNSGTVTSLGPIVGITPNVGDVLRLSVVQSPAGNGGVNVPVLSFFQNGSMILQYTDQSASALSGGNPGILQAEASSGTSQISLFAAGNTNVIPNYITATNLTYGTLLGLFAGNTFAEAFDNLLGWDILQVVGQGEAVIWNLNAQGVATFNPSNPTPAAVLGRYFGNTFAEAFPNRYSLDILQIVSPGLSPVFNLNSQGEAFFW